MDIKANAAIQKGMPYKGYHGRTGVVFNVSKRALTVTVNKLVSALLQLDAWIIYLHMPCIQDIMLTRAILFKLPIYPYCGGGHAPTHEYMNLVSPQSLWHYR